MKEIIQDTGVRLYKGEDFIALQQLTLDLTEKLYAQFGNVILYGCEFLGADTFAPGVLLLDGKACLFDGGTLVDPFVRKVSVIGDVLYKTGEEKPGFETFMAEPCLGSEPLAANLRLLYRLEEVLGGGYKLVSSLDLATAKTGRYLTDSCVQLPTEYGDPLMYFDVSVCDGGYRIVTVFAQAVNGLLLLAGHHTPTISEWRKLLFDLQTPWEDIALLNNNSGTLKMRLNKTGEVEVDGSIIIASGGSTIVANIPAKYNPAGSVSQVVFHCDPSSQTGALEGINFISIGNYHDTNAYYFTLPSVVVGEKVVCKFKYDRL
ncbi:MAG: hypothetical protein LBD91_03170 [Prevotellaceae bacterium]|jgi:hypothetical protein|nr:hypothetical protein [Prevotellaceae bacterium]